MFKSRAKSRIPLPLNGSDQCMTAIVINYLAGPRHIATTAIMWKILRQLDIKNDGTISPSAIAKYTTLIMSMHIRLLITFTYNQYCIRSPIIEIVHRKMQLSIFYNRFSHTHVYIRYFSIFCSYI